MLNMSFQFVIACLWFALLSLLFLKMHYHIHFLLCLMLNKWLIKKVSCRYIQNVYIYLWNRHEFYNSIFQLYEQCSYSIWDPLYTYLDLVESPHSRSWPVQQWLKFVYSDIHGVQSTHNVTLQLKYGYIHMYVHVLNTCWKTNKGLKI